MTPLRNILTTRGVFSGLRDALFRQVDDSSLTTLLNHPNIHLVETWILNTTLLVLVTTLAMNNNNEKIRPWKQFSQTEKIAKAVVIALICILAKNVESAR
jgi:hypothetical protein